MPLFILRGLYKSISIILQLFNNVGPLILFFKGILLMNIESHSLYT